MANLRQACDVLAPHGITVMIEPLNERDIQFPRPDDRLMSRASRQAFGNINLKSRDGRVEGMDAVLRYDTQTGEEDIWHFGAGAAAGLASAVERGISTSLAFCTTSTSVE